MIIFIRFIYVDDNTLSISSVGDSGLIGSFDDDRGGRVNRGCRPFLLGL